MSKNVYIRKALLEDLLELCEISKTTFIDTYGEQNTPENLQKYLIEHFNEEQLKQEFLTPDTHFLLVEFEKSIIGYAKLRVNTQEFLGKNTIELERIYIKKSFHGKSFGLELIQTCVNLAEELQFDSIWLGVWEYNSKAINFYKKYGFEICGEHIFQLGEEAQTDYLMTKKLNIQ